MEECKTTPTTARLSHKSYNPIKNQMMRFKKFRIDGLYEELGFRRPAKTVNHKTIEFLQTSKTIFF